MSNHAIRFFIAGFLFVAGSCLSVHGQTVPTTLPELVQHREQWPTQLTLKVSVQLNIVSPSSGKAVGSIVSPEGSMVNLVAVTDTALQVQVGSASASVMPEQTDLWARVAALTQKSSPVAASPPPASVPQPIPAAIVSTPKAPTPPAPPSIPTITTPDAPVSGHPVQLDFEASGGGFTKAAFRFWSPAYTQPARGVIVLVPGFNGDGRNMLSNGDWQKLARKYRFALVACFMQGPSYYEAPRGTGQALLDALTDFAGKSNHPEIAHVPLLLYGESAGGQFDYDFVLWKPERVMAFVVNKGGFYNGGDPDSRTCAVPGLFFLGMKDTDERIKAITGIWTTGRKLGALWALAPQPNSGHEFSKTAAVARVFFEGVLKNRLPDDNSLSTDDTAPMKSIQESQGWLGDLTTHEIHDASTDTEINHNAAWFPDQASAIAWKAFVPQ
jgi:pimeloyl-ACP methyl ester carboxylesterase